jgi:glutamine---fructose-6-phosphate transaminase (isomerizing)
MTTTAQEIASIPDIVARQIETRLSEYREVGALLRAADPVALITCARGSSDHAALYLKYLVEMGFGLPVCSMGPSLASVYDAPLRVASTPLITISQSGGSTDICALTAKVRDAGGLTIALLNDVVSPLARVAQRTVPMAAGPELAVAATKSFVCSLVALAAIVACWGRDDALIQALKRLPDDLGKALQHDWQAAEAHLSAAQGLFVVSRGLGLSIAEEAALKFKETCNLHAEAYSAAEVLHGPVALANESFSAIAFAQRDAGRESIEKAIAVLRGAGARVFKVASTESGRDGLPCTAAADPRLDPILQITSFYRLVERMSVTRGLNPDAPALLKKVTVTE